MKGKSAGAVPHERGNQHDSYFHAALVGTHLLGLRGAEVRHPASLVRHHSRFDHNDQDAYADRCVRDEAFEGRQEWPGTAANVGAHAEGGRGVSRARPAVGPADNGSDTDL